MEIAVKDDEVQIPTQPLLRYHQREELKDELREVDDLLNPMNPYRHKAKGNLGEVARQAQKIKKQLQDYSPPVLTGGQKDKVAQIAKDLEEKIKQGMPTQEEMRKNPAGMVGRFMKWEKGNKKNILKWKNAKIMLEPDSNDPDLANIETFRNPGELDQFRANAQISGHMGYYNIPQELWDLWTQGKGPNSALDQVKAREAKEQPPVAKK